MSDATEVVFKEWVKLKKRAIETGDWEMYEWFLREVKKEMGKMYAETSSKGCEDILKLASCELHKIMIKYKEGKIPF